MRVTYDYFGQAGYLYLVDDIGPGEVKKTVQLDGYDINLDFNADGHLIGIEILDPALLHPKLKEASETEDVD